jgi:hypothetical protein
MDRHFLRLIIRHEEDDLFFEVRTDESKRIRKLLSEPTDPITKAAFLWFATVDGWSVALYLADMQAIRFLRNPTLAPPDWTRTEGAVRLKFRTRSPALEVYTEAAVEVYNLFVDLANGAEIVPFPLFTDDDDELVQVSAEQLVWVIAPTSLIEEGVRLLEEEDSDKNA